MAFINIKQVDKQKPIYRYTDFGRVVQMFQKKEIALVRPEKWDDPFENFIVDPEYRFANGGFSNLPYRQVMYGSCWTKKMVSDAMWRIYSPDKIAVRIKSTPQILGEELEKSLEKHSRSSWYIGEVQYLPQNEIVKRAKRIATSILNSNNGEELAAKSILLKRKSFSHEQEVRVLVIDRYSRSKNGVIRLKVDPHKLIQSILVDSRAPDEWLDVYSSFLKKELGFKGKISKSNLYKPLERLIINK